jgi:hypothetical protein
MRHEPSGLVRDFQHPMELMRRYALLASGHQVETENSPGQWNVATFHDGAVRHRERATAGIALMQAGTVRHALQASDVLDGAAMRARRTIRPSDRFHVFAGGIFIMEDRIGEVDGRSGSPWPNRNARSKG